MVNASSAIGDLLPILFATGVSTPISSHTIWEHPVVSRTGRAGERPGRVVGAVLSPLHVHHPSGRTKKAKAAPGYKRGAVSRKCQREIIKRLQALSSLPSHNLLAYFHHIYHFEISAEI